MGGFFATKELVLFANYTWTHAENDTPGSAARGKFLVRRPEHQANLTASYVWPGELTTSATVRYVGDSFDNAANSYTLKAYTLVDLRASWPLNDRIQVYGRVENAFDQSFETTRNYGSTGRGAYLGLRASF